MQEIGGTVQRVDEPEPVPLASLLDLVRAGFGAGAVSFWLLFGMRRKRRKTAKRAS